MTAGIEPIPGYVLRERIGMGGFGEVWSVTAPGGLEKAIKLVHGAIGSERANRELRSLDRLRQARHPFLLTLDRYEVVDNHLLIVTERADEGLDQILARYQSRGAAGIPRDELLQYLREAADALDYLRTKYGLQHLDVKPANLLVLSGHVKVADFGLLKDLREVEHSAVGGLTPTYAAPEVFDGRPSVHSDQYSLAIVYQELLTGQRPFSGRTIAQLATQHVHSAPQLDSLPFADRPIIARALEKNPDRRFANCRELMQRLSDTIPSPHVIPKPMEGLASAGDTCVGDPLAHRSRAEVKDAAMPIAAKEDAATFNSFLFLGVGGVGAEVLAAAKTLVTERDTTGKKPISRFLLLDTDSESLEVACATTSTSLRLDFHETLHLPLRTAHDYREGVGSRLGAVSRRWIYNVPRSGRTEGLRPIGRLALADHAESVIARIKDELVSLTEVGTSEVYVVASLVGGTGGGMVLDLLHLVRSLLDDMGHAEVNVIPLLATTWTSSRTSGHLQLASSLSALMELSHYADPVHAYPGDTGAGIAPVPSARSPLQQSILFSPEGNERASKLICDFLRLQFGRSRGLIENALKGPEGGRVVTTRTIKSVACAVPGVPGYDRLLREATYRVLRQVIGKPNGDTSVGQSWVEQIMAEQGLNAAAWSANWFEAHGLGQGSDLQKVLDDKLEHLFNNLPPAQRTGLLLLNQVDRMVSEMEQSLEQDRDYADAPRLCERLRQKLERGIKSGTFELTSAMKTAELLVTKLANLAEEQAKQAAACQSAVAEMSQQIRREGVSADSRKVLREWIAHRFYTLCYAQAESTWRKVVTLFHAVTRDYLTQVRSAVGLTGYLKQQISGSAEDTVTKSLLVSSEYAEGLRTAMADLNSRARIYFVNQQWTDDALASWASFESEVHAAFAKVGLSPPNHEMVANFAQQLPKLIADTRPPLLDGGGEQRRLLLVGDEDQQRLYEPMFREIVGEALTTHVVSGTTPTFVHVGLEIPTADLIARLTTALGPDNQIIGKLHSRADVSWS
jgi:hypothetical protein